MPGKIWRCYSGYPGAILLPSRVFFRLRSEFVTFVVSVTIDGDAFVPGHLSPLLGVLHLFAPFCVETVIDDH